MSNSKTPYMMRGTPRAGGGAKVLSAQELAFMLDTNPVLAGAVERVNRFEGKPRMIQVLMHGRDARNAAVERMNARQIHAGILKQKGLLG
jgi:hypothetical protein